jgi:signal transduction histidine kinase
MSGTAYHHGLLTSDTEARLQLALEVADMATYDWDMVTGLVVRSANAARLLGVQTEGPAATRDEFRARVHPDDRARVLDAEQRSFQPPHLFDAEYRIVRSDGDVRWIADRGRVYVGADGAPVRMIGARMDITDHRRTESALRLSEERLRLALEAGRLGSWELNPQSGALVTSAQCKANHGLPADAALEFEEVLAAIPEGNRDTLRAGLADAIASVGTFTVETPTTWPDGSQHWLLIAGRVIDAVCVVGVTQDVTDRYRWARQVEDMSRRKDVFIATLAHELRQPLTPIVMGVSLMRARGGDAANDKARDIVERQVDQLRRLVDDLIDSARIAQGKVQLTLQPLDVREPLNDALQVALVQVEAKRQRLQVSVPAHALTINGDRERLQQVFANVLLNAAKYTDEGGDIDLSVTATDDTVRVAIRDSGRGIAADALPRVFDIFMQEDERSGLGLGLPVVKRLVELHGGEITAHSDGTGRGSTFLISLPSCPR